MDPETNDSIYRFIRRLPRIEDSDRSPDPNAPQTIFRSPLELDHDQEEALVQNCMTKYEAMKSEQGREAVKDYEWYRSGVDMTREAAKTFMGKRQLYENVYHLQLEWREFAYGEESIYADSNLHLPLTRRIVQQQSARANDYFFSTEPWFGGVPQGTADIELATEVERFTRYKVKKGEAKHVLKKAVRGAFKRGEAVTKVTHRKDISYYKSVASVAIDPATDEPMVAKDGDYLYEEDEWIMGIVVIENPETMEMEEVEAIVLKRDSNTVHPNEGGPLDFQNRLVRRSLVKFEGAEVANVYFKDVLIPLDTDDIQKADCMCHIYDRPAVEFAQLYMDRVMARGGDFGEELPRVIEMLEQAGGGKGDIGAYADQPRPQLGESYSESKVERSDPMIQTAEFYTWFDADNDGVLENCMVVIDLESKKPIYYDYVENITPDGLRPFQVHRINPVENRWYGVGMVETLWPLQESMDLMWNRMNFSQSRSGNVIFWNPDAVVEGDKMENLEINGGETLQLKPGRNPEDAFKQVPLYDIKFDKLREMIEMITQFGTVLSGTSGPNDAAMAGLQTQERATGIIANEKLGQELFSDFIGDLELGVERATKALIMVELAFMNDVEMYEFFENDVRALASIEKHRVHNLEIDVSIELNRFKGEQTIQRLQTAILQGTEFYNLHPSVASKLAPMFRQVLKHLGIKDTDAMIDPMVMMMAMGGEEEQAENEEMGGPMMAPPPSTEPEAVAQAAAPVDRGPEENLPDPPFV